MNGEKGSPPETQIERYFEQPPDAISFYCDFAQVIATGAEIVLQFYETIPGAPGRDGTINKAVSRLKATITFSIPHARNFGKILVERMQEKKIESH
jgi:hypothetical protein